MFETTNLLFLDENKHGLPTIDLNKKSRVWPFD